LSLLVSLFLVTLPLLVILPLLVTLPFLIVLPFIGGKVTPFLIDLAR
jgi:hypothetical protein